MDLDDGRGAPAAPRRISTDWRIRASRDRAIKRGLLVIDPGPSLWQRPADLQIDVLDASRYREKGHYRCGENGDCEKSLLEGPDGKVTLFKPDQKVSDVLVEGRKAVAFAILCRAAGVDTPRIKLVEYKGRVGALQEWSEHPPAAGCEYFSLGSIPAYHESYKRIEVLDLITGHIDRGSWNHLVDKNDRHAIAIDNDRAFSTSPPKLMRTSTLSRGQKELVKYLRETPVIWDVVRPWLTDEELTLAKERLELLAKQ